MEKEMTELMQEYSVLKERNYMLEKSNYEMEEYDKTDTELQEYIQENRKIVEQNKSRILNILVLLRDSYHMDVSSLVPESFLPPGTVENKEEGVML